MLPMALGCQDIQDMEKVPYTLPAIPSPLSMTPAQHEKSVAEKVGELGQKFLCGSSCTM